MQQKRHFANNLLLLLHQRPRGGIEAMYERTRRIINTKFKRNIRNTITGADEIIFVNNIHNYELLLEIMVTLLEDIPSLDTSKSGGTFLSLTLDKEEQP